MTVGAVNGVYEYGNDAYQMQIFGTVISNDRLNYLMQEYGVIQTGDEYYDLQRLYQAMYSYYSKYGTLNVEQGSNQPSQQIPWAGVMAQVGLEATGNKNDDYALFMMTVQGRMEGASEGEKTMLAGLIYQSQNVFSQPEVTAADTSENLSSADIISAMNKAYIV